MKVFCSRTSFSPSGLRNFWNSVAPGFGGRGQFIGHTIASMYAIPFTASRCRFAQSKPSAEPQS